MELLNNSLTELPIDSGFFRPSATVGDYYMLKEKVAAIEGLLFSLEHLASAKFERISQKGREKFELQVLMLRAALISAQRVLNEYVNTFDIETNFSTRLSKCEKRANKIFETYNNINREFIRQKLSI